MRGMVWHPLRTYRVCATGNTGIVARLLPRPVILFDSVGSSSIDARISVISLNGGRRHAESASTSHPIAAKQQRLPWRRALSREGEAAS